MRDSGDKIILSPLFTILNRRRVSPLVALLVTALIPFSVSAQDAAVTTASEFSIGSIIVTIGAVALAVAMMLWAMRISRGARRTGAQWRSRFAVLEAKLDRAETIFNAQPDLIIIWDEDGQDPATGWGRPKVLGNPTALATLLKYAEPSETATPVETILEGLARQDVAGQDAVSAAVSEYNTVSQEINSLSLIEAVRDLRWNGAFFSLMIKCEDGRAIEVEGRPAGAQAVVWITDVTAQAEGLSLLKGKLGDLREEANQLKDFLDVAPFPVWRRDGNAKLAWVNKAYARAVDLNDPETAVERAVELDDGVRALTDRVQDSGEASSEKKYIVIDGERRAFDLIEMPHEEGFMGMALDVTGKDAAEKELKQHIDAHAQTLDKLATAVASFDLDKRITYYNQAYANQWGLDPAWLDSAPTHAEILERLRESRKLPEQADFKAWKDKQLQLHASIAEQPDEYWHLPDSRHLRVACQPHPMGGTLFIYEDVTDRFRLESSLNTLAKVQDATLNNLSEGVAVFGSDGKLELHNQSFLNIWQLESDQLQSQPHFSKVVEWCRPLFDDEQEWIRMAERITSFNEQRHRLAGRLERRDKTFIDYAILPLPNGATLLTCLDVTATTRITQALKERNEALEAADRLKSEFISHVSYQLRTPLTTIKGFSEMLETGNFVEPLAGKQLEYAGAIHEASNQLMTLVDDILDLARIEAGEIELDVSEVDLNELLDRSRELALRQADEKKILIDIEAAPDAGTIEADGRRLRQVLFNLVSNALAFTDEGGTITLGAELSDEDVTLWVQDTGVGIAPEQQATVFDRFESQGSAGRRRGPGLGLSLVRSFVELHGGWVALESEPDVGTKVICHLPARPQRRVAEPSPEKSAAE